MHSRNLVNCCDWFCRGQSIYDIDNSGYIIVRPYGAGTKWKIMEESLIKKFAFLVPRITYIRQDDILMCSANMLGNELRNSKKLVINGRNTRVSNSNEHYTNAHATKVQLMPHQHRGANLYCGLQAELWKLKNMKVLGSGDYPQDLQDCNNLRNYVGGRVLFDHLQRVYGSSVTSMLGACYHMGSDDSNDQITYYQGHLDKPFVCSGWLIPLGVSFFTFVSLPNAWHYQQDEQSLATYNKWIATLTVSDRENLEEFEKAFEADARVHMKNVDCQMYMFENKVGSLLAFPSNSCYHATVTPPSNVPRDLLIVHPLVGDQLL
jgi:hypothetical protein